MKEESACVVNAPRTALCIYNMRRIARFKCYRLVVLHKTARRDPRTAVHASQLGCQILTIPSFSAACTAILSRVAQDAYYRSRGSPARRRSLACQRRGTDGGDIPESPRLSESDTEHPCDPLFFEMGGYLLTYALY